MRLRCLPGRTGGVLRQCAGFAFSDFIHGTSLHSEDWGSVGLMKFEARFHDRRVRQERDSELNPHGLEGITTWAPLPVPRPLPNLSNWGDFNVKKTIFDESYRRLIRTLRQARIRENLTQRDVARLLGRAPTWVGKIECFDLRLDLVWFARLCTMYRVDAGDLIRALQEELS